MDFQRTDQDLATRLAIEIGIKIPVFANEFRIVNERIPSREGFIVEVVLAVFPMVGDDAVAEVGHVFENSKTPFEGSDSMVDDIQ